MVLKIWDIPLARLGILLVYGDINGASLYVAKVHFLS